MKFFLLSCILPSLSVQARLILDHSVRKTQTGGLLRKFQFYREFDVMIKFLCSIRRKVVGYELNHP